MADPGWRVDLAVPHDALPLFEIALEPLGGALVIGGRRDDGRVPLQVFLAEPPDSAALTAGLTAAALAAGVAVPATGCAPVEAIDWVAESQRRLPPIRAGRFFVHGAHVEGPPPQGSIPLLIDANAAFGTGRHESTRGCLLALQTLARAGFRPRRLLDMGCGSGILALAMARLWRRRVLAVDSDPPSVAVAAVNARINRVGGLLRPLAAEGYGHRLVRTSGPFDLIAANILAEPLSAMARDLRAHLAPGGRAILSGLLARQERLVLNKHASLGLRLERRIRLGDWATLILIRKGKRRP